jgi:hypothetical protein
MERKNLYIFFIIYYTYIIFIIYNWVKINGKNVGIFYRRVGV